MFRVLCEDGGLKVVESVHQAALARQYGPTAPWPRPLQREGGGGSAVRTQRHAVHDPQLRPVRQKDQQGDRLLV